MRSRAETQRCPMLYLARQRFTSVVETAKRWSHVEPYVSKLCAAGRVKGPFRVITSEGHDIHAIGNPEVRDHI